MAKAKSKKGATKAAPKAAAKPAAPSKAAKAAAPGVAKAAAPAAPEASPAPAPEATGAASAPGAPGAPEAAIAAQAATPAAEPTTAPETPVIVPEAPAAEPKPTWEGLEAARADCGHGTPEGNRAVARQALAEINALAAEAVADGATSLPRAEGAPVGESPVAAAVLASAAELAEPCPTVTEAEAAEPMTPTEPVAAEPMTPAEPAPTEPVAAESVPAAAEETADVAERRVTPEPMAGSIGEPDPESEANGQEVEDEAATAPESSASAAEPMASESVPVLDAKAEEAGYAAEAVTADSETGPACDPAAEAAPEARPAAAEAAPRADLAEPAGHGCQCKTLAEAPPLLQDNPYLPETATIIEVIDETPDVKTFRVVVDDAEKMKRFRFEPGQVGQLSVFGAGESTFVINSPPTRMDYLQFSVMRVGELTTKLHGLKAGDQVGVRAPLGNWFPYESMKGKDIVFIGGGIGLAPLRTLLLFMLDNRRDYGKITLVYGARNPALLCYKPELAEWAERGDMKVLLTVDQPSPDWTGKVGVVPNLLLEDNPSPDSIAVTCGPPIMIKFTIQALQKLKFPPENIITTLERRMKCGIGICGRCNIGGQFVCVDGPVFSYAELQKLPNEL